MIQSKIKILAPVEKVWAALTEQEHLNKWYFKIPEFNLEVGFEFSFYESEESQEYLHVCKIEEIIPNKLFAHSWAYPKQSSGNSMLKWILETEGSYTHVTIEHTGLENFADGGAAFAPENFKMGWDGFVAILKNYINGIQKLKFDIEINASAEKVWEVLWDDTSYRTWTEPFCPGSHYVGDLKPGGRIHFLSPEFGGMYSDVIFLAPQKMVLFQHIGEVKDGKEQPIDGATEQWTGCFEQYTLKEKEGKTLLKVEVDVTPGHLEYFNNTFPSGLQKIKELAEKA